MTLGEFMDKWGAVINWELHGFHRREELVEDLASFGAARMAKLRRLEKLLPRVLRRLEHLLSEENGRCPVTAAVRKEVQKSSDRNTANG